MLAGRVRSAFSWAVLALFGVAALARRLQHRGGMSRWCARLGAQAKMDGVEHAVSVTRLAADLLRVVLPSKTHAVARVAELTASERAVVVLALSGCSNASIANQRGSTARTVANQLASVYRKLGISGRRELAAAVG
jgi:DNA-binding CsgD family transcriptional regulator